MLLLCSLISAANNALLEPQFPDGVSGDVQAGEDSGSGSGNWQEESGSSSASAGFSGVGASSGDSWLGSGEARGRNGQANREGVSINSASGGDSDTTLPAFTPSIVPAPVVTFHIVGVTLISLTVSIDLDEVTVVCVKGEVFDEVLEKCRDADIVGNSSVKFQNDSINSSSDCNVTIALSDGEFEYTEDNTVLFRGEVLEIQSNTSDGKPVICVNFTQNGTRARLYTYPPGYDIITFVGCSLSCVGCCLVLVTFCLFKELRTLPSKLLVNVTFTVLATNLLTILTVSDGTSNYIMCQAVAILLHLFMLSQFMWMTIMCAEVAHTFYLASRLLQSDSDRTSQKLVIYSIFSWGIPFVIVATSVVLDFCTPNLVRYGRLDSGSCWITHLHSALAVYIAPISISIVIQCVLFGVVGVFLCMSCKTKTAQVDGKSIPYSRIVFALFFATNILWLLGLMAVLVNTDWSWYPFTILQSSQGFIIFLGFFCTRKVLNFYVSKFSLTKLYSLTKLSYTRRS